MSDQTPTPDDEDLGFTEEHDDPEALPFPGDDEMQEDSE